MSVLCLGPIIGPFCIRAVLAGSVSTGNAPQNCYPNALKLRMPEWHNIHISFHKINTFRHTSRMRQECNFEYALCNTGTINLINATNRIQVNCWLAESFETRDRLKFERYYIVPLPSSWWRGTVVERRSLAGELSLSCARPAADGWPLMWVSHPL